LERNEWCKKERRLLIKVEFEVHAKDYIHELIDRAVQECGIEDFIRGRTFGVRGNVRKAIVVKRDGENVWWTWISSVNDIGCDSVADVIAACTWLGPIAYDLLKIVEENGCVPDSK